MTNSEVLYRGFLEKYPMPKVLEKKHLEDSISDYLHKYHKILIVSAAYEDRLYPELLILDRTRNIFGYICIQQYPSDNDDSISRMEFDNITRKRIQICYSELDRPVFFLYVFTEKNNSGIHFLTSEQIQDILLEKIENNEYTPFFPNKEMMGELDELVHIIKNNT